MEPSIHDTSLTNPTPDIRPIGDRVADAPPGTPERAANDDAAASSAPPSGGNNPLWAITAALMAFLALGAALAIQG